MFASHGGRASRRVIHVLHAQTEVWQCRRRRRRRRRRWRRRRGVRFHPFHMFSYELQFIRVSPCHTHSFIHSFIHSVLFVRRSSRARRRFSSIYLGKNHHSITSAYVQASCFGNVYEGNQVILRSYSLQCLISGSIRGTFQGLVSFRFSQGNFTFCNI